MPAFFIWLLIFSFFQVYQESNHSTVLLYDSARNTKPTPVSVDGKTSRPPKQKRVGRNYSNPFHLILVLFQLPPNLIEMMFGTLPMSFEGTTTKFHLLESSHQLLVTKLIIVRRIEGVTPSSPTKSMTFVGDIAGYQDTSQKKNNPRRGSFGPVLPVRTRFSGK